MNISVVVFFVFNVVATALLGGTFAGRKENRTYKFFGIALLLNAVAFAIWSFGLMSPGNLIGSVTLGAIVFLISLVVMFYATVQNARSPRTRWLWVILGLAVVSGVFYMGHADASNAFISQEGFLFFNLAPMVQMLYVFALAFAVFPVVDAVASSLKSVYSEIFRYGMIAQICGGIMLITNKDPQVLYGVGWIIGLVYILLLATFVLNSKAWNKTA
jgi:hypothetical protein